MQTPLVSIIIPTYNRAHLIGATLDSIIAQTYTNWECIVVDDGSKDNTDEVLASYCEKDTRFQYHHRPKDLPKGGNAARNYGFELSKGEYINWFDDDDLMLPEFIKIKALAFNEECQLVICSCIMVDENLQNPEVLDLNVSTYLFKDYVLWDFKIVTNNVLFKKSFLKKSELFDNRILRGQETELFSRLFFILKEEQFKIINTPLFLYRQHCTTKSFSSTTYNSAFRKSKIFICIENFKRSLLLNDDSLKSYCFNGLINYYFASIINKDFTNSKYILEELLIIIKPIDRMKYLEILSLGYLFIKLQKGSYKVQQRWKKFSV